jgi:adenylyltransferase/sulfurtransferase
MNLSDDQLERYARHIILKEVGGSGQVKLLESAVLIVGAGGLGTPLATYLAAAGVGTIGIIDSDTVDRSNLQRQILFSEGDIGRPKVEVAREALRKINPGVEVMPFDARLDASNAEEIFAGFDLVADGCDNFETRLVVSDAATAARKPLVSAALAPFEGQLSTFKPHERGPDGEPWPCYRCLVAAVPEAAERSCSEQGILGAVAGVLGTMQALEVLKELLGIGKSLAGQLLIVDGLTFRVRSIRLRAEPACPGCGHLH